MFKLSLLLALSLSASSRTQNLKEQIETEIRTPSRHSQVIREEMLPSSVYISTREQIAKEMRRYSEENRK